MYYQDEDKSPRNCCSVIATDAKKHIGYNDFGFEQTLCANNC